LELRLAGTPEQMGRDHGRACKWRIRLLCGVYVKHFIGQWDRNVLAGRTAKALAVRPTLDPRHRAEAEALIAAAGIEPGLLYLGNSFLDLGYSAAGCRGVVWQRPAAAGAPGGFLHAHNLDWDSLAGLANWNITIFRRTPADGRCRTVGLALPGMLGALDIINEHGLALSANWAGSGQERPAEPVFLAMRRIAESCRTFAEARAELRKLAPDGPFAITLSAAAEGRAAVFEPQGGRLFERPLAGGVLTADNSLRGNAMADSVLEIAARRAAPAGRTPAALQALLAAPDVLLGCNLYSVIFDWPGDRLYLASGRTPAASRGHREFPLFGRGE
jgi:hypothetical protein